MSRGLGDVYKRQLYGVIGYFVTKLIMNRSEKARKVFSGEEPYKKLFAKA